MEKITKSSDKVLIDPNEPLILPDGTALVGRVEWFLYALCCLDYQNLPTPMSRIEEFANALITGEVPNIEPQSRAEQFFLAILNGNVSDLPQPQSRSEVLLDKLARGEFDLSDVEPIQSSYELLLAYLIKNGGIGNIDYVLYEFSEAMKTMYNTVEKPFKSLELSGNTLVNCVLEDTENDDYTSFDKDYSGTSFTINGTSEGAIKSAILKGQTLVNIPTITNHYTTNKDISGWVATFEDSTHLVKANTKYYVGIFNYSNESKTYGLRLDPFAVDTKITINSNGYGFLIGTTVENITSKALVVNKASHTEDNNVEVLFIEYQQGMENWDIPYFEGMTSVKMPVLKTTGKNLFDMNIMETSKTGDGWTYERTENLIHFTSDGTKAYQQYKLDITNHLANKIKLGEPYSFTSDTSKNITNDAVSVCQLMITNKDGSKHYYDAPRVFTLNKEFSQIDIRIIGHNHNEVGIPSDYTIKNIQLEEGSVATPSEPYKSNILTVNEPVELRGIGDVQDELNLITGEVTQRIGEIALDGSLVWSSNTNWSMGDYYACYTKSVQNKKVGVINLKSPNYQTGRILNNNVATSEFISGESNTNVFYIAIAKSKLTLDEKNDYKKSFLEYLNNNPVTVQYELAQESVKTVDLNVVDQNNNKIDKIHVFDEVTHVNASSDELTPTVNIGKSVSYPTIIKPNTKYTVDLKRNDKPLTVNLGGTEVAFTSGETRKIITTPSTLTNDKLSYYGIGAKCNEIMLIEGEIERNVDYFTGMQSVVMQNQMPILHTFGKNLFNPSLLLESETLFGITKNVVGETIVLNGTSSQYHDLHFTPNDNKTGIVVKKGKLYKLTIHCLGGTSTSILNPAVKLTLEDGTIKWLGSNIDLTDSSCDGLLTWFRICPQEGNSFNNYQIKLQLEEFSTSTSYESYKTSILSCNEDVTLRGIGDVKDELDCLTGEMTQRIEEVTFDGSDDEGWNQFDNSAIQEKTCLFSFYGGLPTVPNEYLKALSDKYIIKKGYGTLLDTDEEMVHIYADRAVYFRILKSKLSSPNVIGFKEWLSQNPLTIQYQLATESIKTVDLNVVDQDGNTIPKIKSYNGVTHLEVTVPKQSLLPNVSAEVATDNSKDMSSLTTKHQEISETQSAIQDSIQFQSDEIDTALMATTEIFESILE